MRSSTTWKREWGPGRSPRSRRWAATGESRSSPAVSRSARPTTRRSGRRSSPEEEGWSSHRRPSGLPQDRGGRLGSGVPRLRRLPRPDVQRLLLLSFRPAHEADGAAVVGVVRSEGLLYFGNENEWIRQNVSLAGAARAESLQVRFEIKDYSTSIFCDGTASAAGEAPLLRQRGHPGARDHRGHRSPRPSRACSTTRSGPSRSSGTTTSTRRGATARRSASARRTGSSTRASITA